MGSRCSLDSTRPDRSEPEEECVSVVFAHFKKFSTFWLICPKWDREVGAREQGGKELGGVSQAELFEKLGFIASMSKYLSSSSHKNNSFMDC